ncbi:serine/threonine-protein kinase [Nannocystis bainbridge]|uniref:Serine/threonine-protein kinase n=1 Tax=Nannocystis bainbridge TaxID=2995303 RepID=A0ABT5E4T3_9BACT|nr:serine/threonine-protein kinase [Nannocystis bainbridge]MDC0720878.1 serine/threonine-protein kinase [Nannocystis bainbridge]
MRGIRLDHGAIEIQMARSQARARLFGRPAEPIRLGRFVVLRRVGSGGMGVVYEAYDPQLDRKVALKLLRSDVGGSAVLTSQLRLDELSAEARAMARLSHPNVVTVFDVGEVDGRVYIAMEYVAPPTLRGWLEAEPRSVAAIVAVMLEAGAGLAAAHRAGLVHRDFKPENVVVPSGEPVRVMDFGLARRLEPLFERLERSGMSALATREGVLTTQLAGTPLYMAPEQFHPGAIDVRADQWAFCATLFEALHGRPPFSLGERLLGSARLRLPTEARSGPIPPPLNAVLRRGLSFDPAQRFESMDALLECLRPSRRRSRAPLLGLAAAAVIAAVTAGLLGARPPVADPCPAREDRLRAAWSEADAAQLHARFAESGLAYAATSAERTAALFDRYGEEWIAAERLVCLLGRSGAEARVSERGACLDERLEALAVTRDELLEGAAGDLPLTVERSVSLATRLPPIRGCEQAQLVPTTDPLDRQARRRLSRHASRARARVQARRLDAAEAALVEARADGGSDHPESEAVLALLEAELALLRAQPERAHERLDRVIEVAGRERLVDLVAEAAVMQAEVEAGLRVNASVARDILRVARVALAVSDPGPQARGRLELVQARVEYDSSHFEAGRRATEAAIEAFTEAGARGRLKLSEGLQMLAIQTFGAGEYEQARAFAEQSEGLQLELLGASHPDLAKTALVLGAVDLVDGRGERAVAQFRRAAALQAESLGSEHPHVAQTLINLGNAYLELGEHAAALAEYERALAILQPVLGRDDPRVLACLANIGGSHRGLGEASRAEAVFREVIVRSRGLGEPGAATLSLALGNLARALHDQGRFAEAEDTYEEALVLRRSVFGDEHPKTAALYDDLGRFYIDTGRYRDATPLIERGKAIRSASFGAHHVEYARSEVSLGLLDLARGRSDEAIDRIDRALDRLERDGRAEARGDARLNLARALSQRGHPGDLERARALIARCREGPAGAPYVAELAAWCASLGGRAPCD